MSKKNRIEKAEQAAHPETTIIFWQDLDDPDLYHMTPARNDGQPVTIAQVEEKAAKYQNAKIILVNYVEDWRGANEQKITD